MLLFQGVVLLKENRKMRSQALYNFFVFKLMDQGELSNFIWSVIPNSNTGLVKAFSGLEHILICAK